MTAAKRWAQGAWVLVAGAACALAPSVAQADRRAYGETYEAVTSAKGELDVESWTSFANEGEVSSGPDAKGVRQMIELEYGLTERWDVALYNMFDIGLGGEPSGYAGLKLETRYRLSMPGEWAVDPVLYFEYQKLFRGDASQKFEGKLILAKDVGAWNFAANLALEMEQLVEGGFNPEGEFALGVSRELGGPRLKAGVETFGKVEREEGHTETFVWAGPSISYATRGFGAMHGLWITLAGGHGLTEESQAWYARAIIGLQF